MVRRREARRGPDPAQAPLPLGPRPHPGRREIHRGRAERDLGARRPHRRRRGAGTSAVTGPDDPAAADAAWAAADTLHVRPALGSRVLRQAADSFDRAARVPLRPDSPSVPGRE